MLCARIVTFSIIDALIFVLSLTYNIPFLEIVHLSGERQKDTRMFFCFFYLLFFVCIIFFIDNCFYLFIYLSYPLHQ